MKACLVKMKKAVESDMNLRDENFNDNIGHYTQSNMHWRGLKTTGIHLYNLTKGLMKDRQDDDRGVRLTVQPHAKRARATTEMIQQM